MVCWPPPEDYFHLGGFASSYSDPFLAAVQYMWINLFACRKTQKTQEGIEITRPCPSFMYFRVPHAKVKTRVVKLLLLLLLRQHHIIHSRHLGSRQSFPFSTFEMALLPSLGAITKSQQRCSQLSAASSQDLSNLRFSNSDLLDNKLYHKKIHGTQEPRSSRERSEPSII